MKKDKFPEGGIVNDNADNAIESDMPEAIIPLENLPGTMKARPLAEVMKSIAALSQVDRLVLYSRLDTIMNCDREKASHGVDACGHLFDEAIKSL